MKWKDFLKRSGLSLEDFKALNVEEKELLRSLFKSGKKLVIVRAGAPRHL